MSDTPTLVEAANEALKPAEAAPVAASAAPVKQPTQDELSRQRKDAAISAQKEIARQVVARADELKKNVNLFFRPKQPRRGFPNEIVQVQSYEGVRKVVIDGSLTDAHVFGVRSWHPDSSWTPPASKFLEDYEQTDAPTDMTANQLPL